MIKRFLIALVLLVVLAVVAGVVALLYVDHIAAAAITNGVEYVGEVRCTVDEVDVSILSGSVGIRELRIMNPSGYPEAAMFSLGRAKLEVRTRSLWNQPLHVRQLEIVKPLVRVEAGPGGSNVRVFLRAVQSKLGADQQKQEKSPPTRLRIDKLLLQDATVQIGSGLTRRELAEITLATVEISDIRGEADQGVTPGELAARIVFELVRAGAVKGNLDFSNLIPPELVKGLDTLLLGADSVINGAADLFRIPLETILNSTRGQKKAPKQESK